MRVASNGTVLWVAGKTIREEERSWPRAESERNGEDGSRGCLINLYSGHHNYAQTSNGGIHA